MRRMYIVISLDTFDKLAELARRDWRPVRDEAGWLLEQAVSERLAREPIDAEG